MPDITEALDHNRFQEIQTRCILAANLWMSLQLAAMRGDAPHCKEMWDKIRKVSVDASDILKALGSKEAS